jgi:hypothetical protein
VTIHQDRARYTTYDSLGVSIDSVYAPIVRVLSNTEMRVQVPWVAPAESALVRVHRQANRDLGRGWMQVQLPDCMRLVFEVTGDSVTYLRAEICAGEPNSEATTLRPRLSFDVVDRARRLLFTTSVAHATRVPGEVFRRASDPDSAGAATPQAGPERTVVSFRAPFLADAQMVRVFFVPEGLDITDAANRASRVLLNEQLLPTGRFR